MSLTSSKLFRTAFLASLAALSSPLLHAQWTAPTKEELSMTSIPQVPGAPAVYLFREEITEDKLHKWGVYVRLKVLTEKGKDNANVELGYSRTYGGGGYTVENIEGRTIHPDGTIVPFSGKPYEKLISKSKGYEGYEHKAKVFTLPDVTVGSIIEYRYALRYDDNYYFSPSWYIQTDLYLRKGHFNWKPTSQQLVSRRAGRENLTSSIAWFPILPAGTEVKQTQLPPVSGQDQGQYTLDLNVSDIPPSPEEEYMPPLASFTYRVIFYYSPYRTPAEYWKNEGKYWAKDADKFIGPGAKVTAAVRELAAPTDTPDQKLRKFYAAVMQMENTDYTRERDKQEDKAAGMRETHNTDDILEHKRGSSDQLAMLFTAMARAAGIKANLAVVTNRSRSIFTPFYLSTSQLDDDIVIVNVDGKDLFLDPGTRYCPYGHLDWTHTFAGGLRQMDYSGNVDTVQTSGEPYTFSHLSRVADVTMDEHGEVTGLVKMTFTGQPAITWRHTSLRGDSTSLNHDLEESIQKMVPGGVKIALTSIDNLTDYEKPLIVSFSIKGPIGTPTGKRLFLPADIFVTNQKATFPHEKREMAVSFHYPSFVQDAFRVKLPANLHVESVPAKDQQQFDKYALYSLLPDSTPNSVIVRRNLAISEILFLPKEYPDLRSFYTKMESKDQENIVLTQAPATAPAAAAKTGTN
jgi:transglutaminase-like putative cysteine protease